MEPDTVGERDAALRFDGIAGNYVKSKSHATGRSLAQLVERVPTADGARVLDVATGAGHTAFAFAVIGASVVALDPSEGMLEATRALAAERGVTVPLVQATAERLPLSDGAFDAVVCRTAAHHFSHMAAAVAEMARTTRRGGRVAVTDLVGYDDPAIDDLYHRIEKLHDPTHVRSYTRAEWEDALRSAGLRVEYVESGFTELEEGTSIRKWCARSNTVDSDAAEILALLRGATPAQQDAMGIRPEGDDIYIGLRKILIVGVKP